MINVINLSPSEFKTGFETEADAVLIDVRTPEENSEKRIPNSINLDIYAPDFHSKILQMDRSRKYFLYCRSGSRSFHAGLFMSQNGFKHIFNLDCGILGWKFDTEKN